MTKSTKIGNKILQFTWWVKGNKKGCKPSGVDRMELEFLDEDIDRTLPDNAMMKIITYQTQIKRVQVNFHFDIFYLRLSKVKKCYDAHLHHSVLRG